VERMSDERDPADDTDNPRRSIGYGCNFRPDESHGKLRNQDSSSRARVALTHYLTHYRADEGRNVGRGRTRIARITEGNGRLGRGWTIAGLLL